MSNFIKSIRKNRMGISLMFLCSILVSLGQLLWKFSLGANYYLILLGIAFYGIGSVIMIIAFRFGSFSVLHPMLTLNYFFALILGYLFLHEQIYPLQIAGVIIIITGVALIGGGDE